MKTGPDVITRMIESIGGLRAERSQAEQGKRVGTNYILDQLSESDLDDVEFFVKSFRRWAEEGDDD